MAVTYDQLQSWKPEDLDSAADQLNTVRKSFQDQQDEMDAGKVPDTWVGEAATRAENRHRRLIADLNDIAAPLSQVINALDEAAASIKKAKDNAKRSHDDATGRGWKVTFSGGVQITDPSPDEDDPDKDKGTMQQLAQSIQDALTDAESAETDLAAVLNHATKGNYDGGDGTIEQASLPPELRNLPEDELIDKMLSDPGKYDGYTDALPPGVQIRLGEEISNRLDNTLNDEDYDLSQEEVDRLNSMLSAYTDDETVAAGLYKDLGADGTVASMARIEEYLRNPSVDAGSLDSLASNLRNGLGSASNDPSFPAKQFGHDLVKYAGPSGVYLSDDEQDALRDRYPNWGGTGGASVLTYLMKDHDLNGDLVLGAAEELDRFEQVDGAFDAKTWYHHTGHGPLGAGENGYGADPMAAIMGNLGAHPEQGYEFFHGEHGAERQDFYFDKRTWQADGYAGISELAEGVGTDPGLLEKHPEETTKLVSNFLDKVANSEGFNADDAKSASPHLSNLLKFYTPAVDQTLHFGEAEGEANSGPYDGGPLFPDFDFYPEIYQNDLDSLMQVAVSTDEGAGNIAEGIGAFQQTKINNAAVILAENPDDPNARTQLQGAIQDGAALQGFAEYSVGEVEIENAQDKDARVQAFSDLIGEAAGFVPLPGADVVGELGSKAISAGFTHGVELGQGALTDHYGANEGGAVADQNSRAAQGATNAQINAYLTMVRAGVIDDATVPDMWKGPDGELLDPSAIRPDDLSTYGQSAANGISGYSTRFDISGPYEDQFRDYYGSVAG
ncbi:WXG100 family type VII secretion target [Nocardioides albus]|uniref:Uncharacterized protein YukE n=1 Tax=Nocardioides albus TaxID=1841 RepID=A0A7W5A7H5_9ACTN|nr:WXG100 family type VII secretion target [Nocardioides albus]MBB3090978.1 uncharacterized protein YukE [Nocardioides albus]GGU38750.1 hypothetical protein GCM10007979_42490 [Nocardioides albus]